ncbi:SDR family NAD(P)-dependent oxidoreductase [Streptomyces natalensis]|uniref:SDR family NAD(P)-dependent oxidoreductase n=1 Tax=Streptomyces natalensis TaxID=68242 RepID=UPI00099E0073|nr:SDR family NAD(P)-dependent oxidoreductase [Streptomyces natalensis]
MSARKVFVTGGSRGLGLAIASSLVEAGYEVTTVARRPTEDLQALIDGAAGAVSFLAADLATSAGVQAVALEIRRCQSLYGLVNNAGIAHAGLHVDMEQEAHHRMWSLNVAAPQLLSRAAAKSMLGSRTGRIVNISSVSAHKTYRGLAGYTATKAALEAFSRVLAAEVGGWGITVNCVAPGFIDTAMTSSIPPNLRTRILGRRLLDRQPTANDVGEAVLFLLSGAAGTITGQVLRTDAGAAT